MRVAHHRFCPVLVILAHIGIGVATGGDGQTWAWQTYVKASNTGTGDQFGMSVAVSGDIMVVGAPTESSGARGVNGDEGNDGAPSAGAAYVYVRHGFDWIQEAYLKASNTGADDRFGTSVAVDGQTIIVGAPMEDSAATEGNGSGGGNGAESAGAAYVFVRRNGLWFQQAYLKASNAGAFDHFGASVSVSGDSVVVGAEWEASAAIGVDRNGADNSAARSGAAYVFARQGETWTQQAYLKPTNTNAYDLFGTSVALSGDTVIVGAIGESSQSTEVNRNLFNNSASGAGAAYIFVRRNVTWVQEAYLKPMNAGAGDRFGASVALLNNTALVGAPHEAGTAIGDGANNNAPSAGAAYVFERVGSTWAQSTYLKSSATRAYGYFGESVCLSPGQLAVGAHGLVGGEPDPLGVGSGTGIPATAVSVFTRGERWLQSAVLATQRSEETDHFGSSVSISGGTIAVGAPEDRSSATGINGNAEDTSTFRAGAAYVFTGRTDTIPAIVSTTFHSNGLRLNLPPVFGRVVGVEYSPDLRAGTWIELGNFYRAEHGMTFLDPDLLRLRRSSGYYRAFFRPQVTR